MMLKKFLTYSVAASLIAGSTAISASAAPATLEPAEEMVEGNQLFSNSSGIVIALVLTLLVILVATSADGDDDGDDDGLPVSP